MSPRQIIPLLLATALVGCSKPQILLPEDPPPDPMLALDEPPADFALAVTVYSPAMRNLDEVPRVLRPARYVLEPDGILRTSVGPGAREDTFPPITRRLTQEQVRLLWLAVRDAPLLGVGSPIRVESGAAAEPLALAVTDPASTTEPDGPGASTAVVYFARLGEREWFSIRLDGPGVEATPLATLAARELVERLAELSWMTE
ncbi:MAG: hypothetical protein AAGB51_08085 [Planctomycetota bacterium]